MSVPAMRGRKGLLEQISDRVRNHFFPGLDEVEEARNRSAVAVREAEHQIDVTDRTVLSAVARGVEDLSDHQAAS